MRLDSLGKWPSAESEENMYWTILFLKHTNPDITMSLGGLSEGQAGWSLLGLFAGLEWKKVDGSFQPGVRGTITLKGAQTQPGAVVLA